MMRPVMNVSEPKSDTLNAMMATQGNTIRRYRMKVRHG